jgi:DNA-binding PadR family transcriptional regulator
MIMVSLAGGPKHGYAIMEDVAAISSVNLSSGTVYAALTRLEKLGLIEALAAEGGRRSRHPYRLTRIGRIALRWHLAGVRRYAAEGQRRLGEQA